MNTSNIQIISALVWAVTLICIAYLLGDAPNKNFIIAILFAGANIHFLLLAELHNSVLGIKGKGCSKPDIVKK